MALLYGSKCWAFRKEHIKKMSAAWMCTLGWMCGNTFRDRIRNLDILRKDEVADVEDKIKGESATMVWTSVRSIRRCTGDEVKRVGVMEISNAVVKWKK